MAEDSSLHSKYFYAIAVGRRVGIFKAASVAEYNNFIRRLTSRFPNNEHQRFNTFTEAMTYMRQHGHAEVNLFNKYYEQEGTYSINNGLVTVLEGRSTNLEPDACRVCGGHVGSDDLHPQCGSCARWFHLCCAGAARQELLELPDGEDWTCVFCVASGGAAPQSQFRGVRGEATSEVSPGFVEPVETTNEPIQGHLSDVPPVMDARIQHVFDLLVTRLTHLESENGLLKVRVGNLEEELKSRASKQKANACVEGLKLVTDEAILQNNELIKLKKDVASLKCCNNNSQGGLSGAVREVGVDKNYGSWVEVVRKGRKKGRAKQKQGRVNRYELIADSHGRDLVQLLNGAEVTVKRGARMEGVVEAAGREGMSCTVVMGGTNDVTEQGVKRGLCKLREKLGNSRRKVVIVGVPHRYDSPYPLVENMIARKNDLLRNFCDYYGYKFLSIDNSERSFFTRHGLHFNQKGKRWLANKIQSTVNFLL